MREHSPKALREMTEDELRGKARELQEAMFNLRFRNSMKQLDNPLKIREIRRALARIETLLAEHKKGIRRLADHGSGTR
ncbi:MAG: 50S ribosomal protein L29 [Candidatus Eisenbacteria bacterium]|nr:50S ribosomal protein L29 [Candidatus Eisenbacteria bacterium]